MTPTLAMGFASKGANTGTTTTSSASVNLTGSEPKVNLGINFFKWGEKGIPHPDKVDKGGEDAYSGSANLLVVADGVGGWARHGVDPGLYSKELVANINKLYDKNFEKYRRNPKQLSIDAASMRT